MVMKRGKHFFVILLVAALLLVAWSVTPGCGMEEPAPPPDPPAEENDLDNQELEKDNSGETNAADEEIILYFANGQADRLLQETRQVVVTDRDINVVILEELIKGPQDPELGRTVPEDTRVNQVEVEAGLAYADFSEELRTSHWGGSTGEILTVYSIVNTLAERPEIDRVQFIIDGEEIETLAGHIELSEPLDPDPGWVE